MPTNMQKKLNFCQKSILLNESFLSLRSKQNCVTASSKFCRLTDNQLNLHK